MSWKKAGAFATFGAVKKQVIFKRLDHAMTGMKEQIQQLIAGGQTKDALNLLVQMNPDALLLQAQYNNGEKQFNLGLIEFSEWGRIQARVNFAALEMAGNSATSSGSSSSSSGATTSGQSGSSSGHTKPSDQGVFISYNHNDAFAMRAVKAQLEDSKIKVYVDIAEIKVGENIQEFIDKALEKNMFILSLVSKNSLVSGWVNGEISTAILLNKFGKKWIPARLDDSCFDDEFYFETLKSFDERIEKARANVQRALDHKVDIRPFQNELARLDDLKSNFGKIIQTLKEVMVVDISEKFFESGVEKIVKTINAHKNA